MLNKEGINESSKGCTFKYCFIGNGLSIFHASSSSNAKSISEEFNDGIAMSIQVKFGGG